MKMRLSPVLFLVATVGTFALAATVYQWVDENGVVQYSDVLPPGKAARSLEVSPPSPAPPPGADWGKVEEAFAQRQRERNRQLDRELHGRALDAELEAAASGKGTPVPGETQALRGLQARALFALIMTDQAFDPACTDHKVVDTQVLDRNVDALTVRERWAVNRCGTTVAYVVVFRSPRPLNYPMFGLDEESSFTIGPETRPQR